MGYKEFNLIPRGAKKTGSGTGYLINVRYLVSNLPDNRAEFVRHCKKSHSWINNIIRTGRTSGLSAQVLLEELDLDPQKLFVFEEQPEEQIDDRKYAIADALDAINATLQRINDNLYELLKAWEGK